MRARMGENRRPMRQRASPRSLHYHLCAGFIQQAAHRGGAPTACSRWSLSNSLFSRTRSSSGVAADTGAHRGPTLFQGEHPHSRTKASRNDRTSSCRDRWSSPVWPKQNGGSPTSMGVRASMKLSHLRIAAEVEHTSIGRCSGLRHRRLCRGLRQAVIDGLGVH